MRPKEAANLEFWEEMLLLDGFLKMQEEAPEYADDPYASPATGGRPPGVATWTNTADDAPLHHYPSATDKMASPEELITLGVQYAVE